MKRKNPSNPGYQYKKKKQCRQEPKHNAPALKETERSGLSVSLAEGVSAIDRLGSYCFTGFPKSLMGSVLKPLGTMDGVERGAWPYIDAQLLDLQGGGGLSLGLWPRGENGRPLLMHVASIGFHYGPEAAASRHSNTWFRELGSLEVGGPSGAAKILEEIFRDLWVPQMVAFVTHQFNRALGKGIWSQGASSGMQESVERQREAVQAWSQSINPFSWEYVRHPTPFWRSNANFGGIY